MSGPAVEIDIGAVEHNTRSIVELCGASGIEVMGVTKGVFGHPDVASAMVRGGVTSIGDSRLENIARLRQAGTDVPLALLRAPSLSRLVEVVHDVDVSLHTELDTLGRLGTAARDAHEVHDVIVMVDLGDRREGVLPESLPSLARAVSNVPGIRLEGIGTNLTCLTGLEPTIEIMHTLIDLAERVEDDLSLRLKWISAGNSSALPLVAAGAMPERVNQLRIGEAILLGRETVHHQPWPGTVQDAVVVHAEVMEVKDKPPGPAGPRGDRAFGRARGPASGGGRRALVGLGRADVDVEGLTPVDPGHRILGASSDYIVVDVTAADTSVRVGDELSFAPDYSAMVTAVGARGVATRIPTGTSASGPSRVSDAPLASVTDGGTAPAEVAFLVADGFEDSELRVPYERLSWAGHHVTVVGAAAGRSVRGKRGSVVEVEVAAADVDPGDLDAVVVPGGHSPDKLRLESTAVDLVRRVGAEGRLVAAICHGPSLLIDADLVQGRTVTSWPSIRRDLEHAGATWVDRTVVEDANLVTSRKPGDVDEFSNTILGALSTRRP